MNGAIILLIDIKVAIKVHNMTSDVMAKPLCYADRRELKSLSYFGI